MNVRSAPDHYRLLGLAPDAPAEAVRAAYVRRIKTAHPDVAGTGDSGQLLALRRAYECLRDPDRRAAYDAQTSTVHRARTDRLKRAERRLRRLDRRRGTDAMHNAHRPTHWRAAITVMLIGGLMLAIWCWTLI